MAIHVTEQLRTFLLSILLGLGAGVLYDLLRAVRLRHPRLTAPLDLLYCQAIGLAVFLFVLRQSDGQLRGFILLGGLGGGVLFFSLLSRPLRPVWDFWMDRWMELFQFLSLPGRFCAAVCEEFAFQAKTIFVLLLGIAAIILLNFSSYRNLIMAYLPTNLSIESITSKEFAAGDSDYLMNIQVNNGVGLIFWTIIRMFFFVFSPLPGSTTSLKYIFAFIVDSVPTAVIIFLTIKDAYYNKKGKYVFAAYAVCLIVIGIFAWGVSNAGTAMRHRSLIVGVFAIAYCMANEKKLIPVKIVDETKAAEE